MPISIRVPSKGLAAVVAGNRDALMSGALVENHVPPSEVALLALVALMANVLVNAVDVHLQ